MRAADRYLSLAEIVDAQSVAHASKQPALELRQGTHDVIHRGLVIQSQLATVLHLEKVIREE